MISECVLVGQVSAEETPHNQIGEIKYNRDLVEVNMHRGTIKHEEGKES